MSTIWTHELLDGLRQIGDPLLDEVTDDEAPDDEVADGDDAERHDDQTKADKPRGWRSVHAGQPFEGFDVRGAREEVQLLQTWRRRALGALPDAAEVEPDDWYWAHDPPAADDRQLAKAQELFVLNGGEIAGALLMAALPATYAARTGAEVLARTGELQSNARRRIAETAQLTVDVLFPDEQEIYPVDPPVAPSSSRSLKPGGHGYVRVLSTRLTHAVIRELVATSSEWDPSEEAGVPRRPGVLRGVPINQEDLLGVLGTFTISVIDAVEKLGITWSPESQQAYIELWDRVGALLGIGCGEVTDILQARGVEVPDGYDGRLRPRTVDEFRELVDLIIERSWPIPRPQGHMAPFDNTAGKELVRALLDELQSAMPRGMERLPLMIMRYLVHPHAQELLGLGGGGVLDAMVQLPRASGRRPTGPMWLGEMVVGTGMRMLANEVSRRAFVHFIRTRADDPDASDFWFPAVPAEAVRMQSGRQAI